MIHFNLRELLGKLDHLKESSFLVKELWETEYWSPVRSHFYPPNLGYIILQGKRDFAEVIKHEDFKVEKLF